MGTESMVTMGVANNSLLPNETGSTRIWKLPMRLLRDLRVNWNLWLEAGLGVDRIGEGNYVLDGVVVVVCFLICPFNEEEVGFLAQ
jgi:hypothetical protein